MDSFISPTGHHFVPGNFFFEMTFSFEHFVSQHSGEGSWLDYDSTSA